MDSIGFSWKFRIFLGSWTFLVVILGAILMSYHQPFRLPDNDVLKLAGAEERSAKGQWQAVHFLSGSCGCSQRVMRHLLGRGPLSSVDEHVVLVDESENAVSENYLAESPMLVENLKQRGFRVTHIASRNIPPGIGLHGVPLLALVAPDGIVAYMGGYGSGGDQDMAILAQVRSGHQPRVLPLLGCAVGARLKRASDPFLLKF